MLNLQYAKYAGVCGTGLVGYMRTTYDDIVKVLGEPHYVNEEKVTAEWSIRFVDGPVVTIYDWKENETPKGYYDWHIGGVSDNALTFIAALFRSAGVSVSTRK